MKPRRIVRQKMERIWAAVSTGQPLDAALAKEGISPTSYAAWVENNREVLERDDGTSHWFVGGLIVGGMVGALGLLLDSGLVLTAAFWILLVAMVIEICDKTRRGVIRHRREILRYEEEPASFLTDLIFDIVFAGVFLAFLIAGGVIGRPSLRGMPEPAADAQPAPANAPVMDDSSPDR